MDSGLTLTFDFPKVTLLSDEIKIVFFKKYPHLTHTSANSRPLVIIFTHTQNKLPSFFFLKKKREMKAHAKHFFNGQFEALCLPVVSLLLLDNADVCAAVLRERATQYSAGRF